MSSHSTWFCNGSRPPHPLKDNCHLKSSFFFSNWTFFFAGKCQIAHRNREAQKDFFLGVWKRARLKKTKNRTCFHSTCVNLVLISTCCCVKSGPNNQARNDVKGTGTLLTVAGVSFPNCPPHPHPPIWSSTATVMSQPLIKGKRRQCAYCVCMRKWNNEIQTWVFDVCLYDSFLCVSSEGENNLYIF